MSEILSVENLSHTYSAKTPFEKKAVKNVSFSLEKGEFVAVIGHTGSGKSTLIQMLNGLIKPTEGRVLFEGKDIWSKESDIRAVRFRIGLCFQYPEYQLFEETVYNDIAFGPKNKGLTGAKLEEAVRNAAFFAGLDESLLSVSPFELSGGQKRRAAIAGVIAMEPDILILDEPTAGLDPVGRDCVLAGVDRYRRNHKATVVLVTHRMEDAARYADRILVMNKGELAYFGTCREIFSHAEPLQEMGLGLPQPTELMLLLRRRGYALPSDVFTASDAVEVLLPFLTKGGTPRA